MKLLLVSALAALAAAEDPEITMTTPEIIRHWGYPAEEVPVTTKDGYVLTMHRIPWGKAGPGTGPRPVVFMQHGLECSSSNWVVNTPEESAGFIFADAGYDVWLGNMRGNTYGKAHTTLDPKSEKFWEFSWDEMSHFDLQAMIDHALAATNQSSLYYIGHSQGTLTMFSKLSVDHQFASKIKKFFALAPVGSVAHIEGLLRFVEKHFLGVLDMFYDIFGTGEFLPSNWVMKMIAEDLCQKQDIASGLCDNIMFLIAGPESNQFNASRAAVYAGHTPAGTSTKNVMHWVQMVKSGTVSLFDYGSAKKNEQHYGTSTPPAYDFARIKDVPIYLYWSDADVLADKDDVTGYLIPNLNPTVLKENNHLPQFNHLDFIWGLNAAKMVYSPILKTIAADL